MISVVMAYYNRQAQLTRTLISMSESKYRDFNVVIVGGFTGKNRFILERGLVLSEQPYNK